MLKEKQLYESPAVDVIGIETEQAVAVSLAVALGLSNIDQGSQDIENRANGGNWGDGGWY